MEFSIKQENNLRIGTVLSAELKSSRNDLRKFIILRSYLYDENNRVIFPPKNVNNDLNNLYYSIRCYELQNAYFDNNWDVAENDIENNIFIKDIRGIEVLKSALIDFISDFSILMPDWYSDNLL